MAAVSAPLHPAGYIEAQTRVNLHSMPLLKHQAADMYQSIFIIESSKLEPIFCVLDLLFWIAQVMYRGQTRYTRNLYLTSLIEAYYSTQHILELKYFLFAHFSLNVTWADP